ncbi:lycopene cyclase domain-containing protein [Haladaptatus sp. F3-133]|uniref:Lycopene cyclase domain-containing protein n=2 Tax=Halorutilus salinus TaxID=2487751 RepID=A0A9Q4GGK7_9EURY|nr:lycopene cyclase domain-containing protein [Halorutilus salinus]MCX2818797.1 lycopene cyclase domain-containing protein [Halorutilus salinus]
MRVRACARNLGRHRKGCRRRRGRRHDETKSRGTKLYYAGYTTTVRGRENEGKGLNYLTFHLLFTVPVLAVLGAAYLSKRLYVDDPSPLGTAIIGVIALLYTTPWDGYMIRNGVWRYGEGTVSVFFWDIPLGEYLFFVIQPLIVGLWLYLVLTRLETRRSGGWTPRYLLTLAGLGVTVAGLWWAQGTETFYIGMILVWAGPVFVLQWAYGGHYLVRNFRVVAAGVVPPAVYLASADRFAIEDGIWIISDELTTGVTVLGLPVEEGAFFFVTSLLVVQGVMLFRWTLDEWRVWVEEYETLRCITRLAGLDP